MTFPFTRPQFEAKKQELAPSLGQLADKGLIFRNGVKLEYEYNESSSTLTLTIKEKPFLLTEAVIESQVRSWLQSQPPPA